MIQIKSRSNYRILKILGFLGGYTPTHSNELNPTEKGDLQTES